MAAVPPPDPPATPGAARLLRAWYLATPVLVLLDLLFGLNVRAAFLDTWPSRVAYYAMAFACGLAVQRWPGRAALVGLVESGVNIAWLIVAVGLRYLGALDAALADDATGAVPFTGNEIVNLVLSAVVLIVSYIGAMARLQGPRRIPWA